MADDGGGNEPTWNDGDWSTSQVASDMLAVWMDGSTNAVCQYISVHVAPRLLMHLGTKFNLQEADCQDCLGDALDRFYPAMEENKRKVIANPYGYFFKIGINAALGLLRERKAELIESSIDVEVACGAEDQDFLQEVEGHARYLDPSTALAVLLVEEGISEVEVDEFWAVEVVRMAISRLPRGQQRVAELLMYEDLAFEAGGRADFDYSAEDAGSRLGMKANAFRTAKHRALKAIREAIPALIIELEVQPPERAEAAIFPDGRGRFLDD